jgi:integrase
VVARWLLALKLKEPMKQKITKSLVDKLALGTLIWDTDIKGFGIRYQSRDKVYYLKSRVAGKQCWIAIGPHGSPWTVETAREKARSLLGQKADGANIRELRNEKNETVTVNELADRYMADHALPFKKQSSAKSDFSNLANHIRPKLGKMSITEIDRNVIARFLQEIASGKIVKPKIQPAKNYGGGAIAKGGKGVSNRCRSLLSKMFNLAERWELMPQNSNPVSHSAKYKENQKERYLSKEEMDALGQQLSLEQAARPYHVAAYRLLMLTGARLNEILSLEWSFVDFERQTLFLPDSKTGKKQIPLSSAAIAILESLPRVEGNPHVIVGHGEGKHLVNLRKHWMEMRVKIGLDEMRLHDLRHSFASTAIMAGVPIAVIGKLLGHKNSKTTERYAHIGQDPIRAAGELVSAKISSSLTTPSI